MVVKFIVGSNAPNGFMFQSNIGGTMTTHMSIRGDTGRVGIGTNAPGDVLHVDGNTIIGDTDRESVVLTLKAQNTAGAPAATTKLVMKGYEGRGIGTFYEDSSYSGEQWFCGMNYSGGFNSWNVGYDASGDQAEYVANTLLQLHYTGKLQLHAYGSGTHTGTAAYKLAVDSSGNVIETAVGAGQVDGSGTANYVAKWTDGDTIGNSILRDDGTRLAVGAAPSAGGGILHLKDTTSNQAKITLESANAYNSWINFSAASNEMSLGYDKATVGGLVFANSDTIASNIRMVILSGGSVGIGTNNPSCLLQLGTDGVQGGASLAIRRNGDSINFGHVNGAGYGSVIGCSSNNGNPHIGFMCEAGTNINTFRTRGLKGNVIFTNTSGTLNFGQVTNANADNQSVTTRVAIESDGDAYFYGGNWFCNTNNSTNVSNGGLYINRGGGLYAYALATARSGTALNGVDFWDYHGVGLVFGPDSSTKVLTVKSNIGIGTTDPGYKLEVKASVTGNWLSGIYNTATSGNSSGLLVRMDEPGSTGKALGVYANGGYKFTVEPDGEVQILSGAAYTTHLNYQNSGTHYISMANGGATYFRGSSNSITTMTVLGTGSVGIGGTPSAALDLFAANASSVAIRIVGGNKFQFLNASSNTNANIYNSGASGAAELAFQIAGVTKVTIDNSGKVGILDSSPDTALSVNGEASFGDQSRLSLIGLTIASSAASPNIKIRTKIPFALGAADFTVNIKGFIYGNAETANLTVCWHYYNSTFYNATCSSSGGWAPTIQLSAEDWDSSGTKKVCICLSTPGYWVKMYVESMFSHSYANAYADGWTWVDGTASGTGNDLASLSYRSDFGNNFRMLSSGSVGVGVTPSRRFQVNGVVSFRPNGSSNDQHYFTTSTANNPQYLMYNSAGTLINKFAVAADSYITGGNVGINTTSTGYKLDVYGGDARIGTNLRLGNGSAAGNSTNPAITSSGVTTAGVYFENSGVGFGAGSGSKYLFLSSAGNASLGGNGFFKQLGDRPYGTDNLNDYYRSNDEASFCQFYRYDATHGHWANSSGTLTTNAPSTLTQTTSQIYSYGSLLTLRSLNSFRGQFYFAHSASEFYWRSGWGTSSDQNWTRIVGDRNIQTVINNVGTVSIGGASATSGVALSVKGDTEFLDGDTGTRIGLLYDNGTEGILELRDNNVTKVNLRTAGASYFTGGNVGIGTNNPNGLLNVAGNTKIGTAGSPYSGTNVVSLTINGVYPSFALGYTSNRFTLTSYSTYTNYETVSNAHHVFSGGNVGIASASPAATLDVKQGTATNNNKLMKVADDVLSVYKVTGLSNHTVTLTCGSYFQAEVVITANQTNGGTYNNLYIRGIWSNNHHSHHWDEIENIGSL